MPHKGFTALPYHAGLNHEQRTSTQQRFLREESIVIVATIAFGMAIDAGVQYVTGAQDNFKFGISLRNIGTPMRYSGQGLDVAAPNPNVAEFGYSLTYAQRSQKYELPSVLNIGMSYDFIITPKNRLTV